MRRGERALISLFAVLLAAALIHRLYTRGGPYLEPPATIMEHVGPRKHETRDALLLLPMVRPLLPRGAQVTCFRPNVPEDDDANYLTAVGQLPDQTVLPVFTAATGVTYVVAVRAPFVDPRYRVVADFPPFGRLYRMHR